MIEQMYRPVETPASKVLVEELAKLSITQTLGHVRRAASFANNRCRGVDGASEKTHDTVEVVASVGDSLITGISILRVFGGNRDVDEGSWKELSRPGWSGPLSESKIWLRLLVEASVEDRRTRDSHFGRQTLIRK